MSTGLDIGQLRQLYRSNEIASLYLDYSAQQARDQVETQVDHILRTLTARGAKLSRGQIIELFRTLETLGCGQFVGTQGQPSRFVWNVSSLSIGRVAAGESQTVESINRVNSPRNRFGDHPTVAAGLSVLPGVGHIYIGQWEKGVILLVVAGLTLGIGLIFLVNSRTVAVADKVVVGIGLILILLVLPSIVDVVVLAKRLRKGREVTRWECFWNRTTDDSPVWEVSTIIKRGRSEQPIGVEERLIDNSGSSSRLIRDIKVSREWSYSYHVEHEQSTTKIEKSIMQVRDGVTRERSLEEVLCDRYGYSYSTKHVFEESVQVEVQPNKCMKVLLRWKNILEAGTIVLQNQHGQTREMPFWIVVGITFDQAQIEE